MSADVARLPTAARSFYTVRRSGRVWAVLLITPTPVRLRTTIARFADRAEATAYGRAAAAAVHRPFAEPGQ